MPDSRIRTKAIVILDGGEVLTRFARKNGVERIELDLTIIFVEEGFDTLRGLALHHFEAFINRDRR